MHTYSKHCGPTSWTVIELPQALFCQSQSSWSKGINVLTSLTTDCQAHVLTFHISANILCVRLFLTSFTQHMNPCVVKNSGVLLLLSGMHSMNREPPAYLDCRWTFALLVVFTYYKQSYCEHFCASDFTDPSMKFDWISTQEWNCWAST